MIVERILMAILLGAIATGCVVVLYPFASALLWAAILAFTTWPLYRLFRARIGRIPAALLMSVLSTLLVVLPIAVVASAGAEDVSQITVAARDLVAGGLPPPPAWIGHLPGVGARIDTAWRRSAADISAAVASVEPWFGTIASSLLSLLLRIAGGILQFALAVFIAFFFWISGDALGLTVRRLLHRIAGGQAERLLNVTGSTVRGTVYGVLGTALLQGILTGAGLSLAHVPSPVLFGAIAAFVAVLPIGAPLVWIPAALWLLWSHHVGWGIFLLGYGVLVISGVDHVVRPAFIARGAQLPYLITVLGVLGGVVAFGALGIFLGPVLLGVGFSLVAEFARTAPMLGTAPPPGPSPAHPIASPAPSAHKTASPSAPPAERPTEPALDPPA
ncbi:putative PurR-regulated permease PerM [Endobacter medicaginis]|uniref:AI-2E family transporter n=2 Tax=Endobacter medicaginis TaxID=1181271 RepID=A0A850NWG1_9PROT|nr:AI-2E family transporter [Endobacter medicaginis]MBB3172698.1 putative PurR-regulated permease PerM [Endobacter medicaginis]NVN30297.1 AI-2E family transporter [Endobacter medicaginis]